MKIVGHRGAKGLAEENTFAAVEQALKNEVDQIELDIRVTADNIPVLAHDKSLITKTEKMDISKTTLKQLVNKKKDLATLDGLLNKFKNKADFILEIKKNEPIEPILDILEKHINMGLDRSKIVLASKSQSILIKIHNLKPLYKLMVIEPWSGVKAHFRAKQIKTDLIAMNSIWLWSFFIKSVSSSNFKLYAYTINDLAKVQRWQQDGLYGVVTDYPNILRKLNK